MLRDKRKQVERLDSGRCEGLNRVFVFDFGWGKKGHAEN